MEAQASFSDHNLIFVMAQPRSGTTLLQHILGSHPEIHTLPEPWFMLHLVYALRSRGIQAEYNSRFAYQTLEEFLSRIPGGREHYRNGIRRFALELYQQAVHCGGKSYFLDKSNRYYLISSDLQQLFPSARFIVQLRNPLAVLASVIDVQLRGNLPRLFEEERILDLVTAPRVLRSLIESGEKYVSVVHYEALVQKPELTVERLCSEIGVAYFPEIVNYGGRVRFADSLWRDPKSIYQHERPVVDYVDAWSETFQREPARSIARAYLRVLGCETIQALGYSYGDLEKKLGRLGNRSKQSVSRAESWFREPASFKKGHRRWMTLRQLVDRRGIPGALLTFGRRFLRRFQKQSA